MPTMTLSRTGRLCLIALASTAVLVGGASFAYAHAFADRALPRTTIAGHSVTGMKHDELVTQVAALEKATNVKVELQGAPTTYSLADLGVDIDEEKTAEAALALSDSVLSRFSALLTGNTVELVLTRDAKAPDTTASVLAAAIGDAPVNASVQANAEGVFEVIPGKRGITVDPEPLNTAITHALATLEPTSAQLYAQESDPKVTDALATAIATRANELASPETVLSDGIATFPADRPTRASWVALPADLSTPDAPAHTHLDRKIVGEWVTKIAQETNVAPVPKINNVDASGTVLVEGAQPGKSGLSANNADALSTALADALEAGKNYSGEFSYDDVAPSTQSRPVMAGHESYAYAMGEGEKWIDVDLSANRLTAYEGQTPVLGPYPINHGSPGHETVTGTYHVYLQYTSQDMGCTPDWPYCAKDVPWVSYFTGSYAIHGAPWVSQFGLGSVNGSHGCVNLPVEQAHAIFSWAGLGTPVASHY